MQASKLDLRVSSNQHSANACGHLLGVAAVLGNDEQSVVAGDGSDHFSPAFSIESSCDGLRGAGGGANDKQVLGFLDVEDEFANEANGGRKGGIGRLFAFLEGVAIGSLDEAKFVDVPRKCGLCYLESAADQGAT